jgi:hypothetical protein
MSVILGITNIVLLSTIYHDVHKSDPDYIHLSNVSALLSVKQIDFTLFF